MKLGDFPALHYEVEVNLPDGETVAFPFNNFSFSAYLRIGLELPDVTAPIIGADPSNGKPLRNYDDLKYRTETAVRGYEVNLRALVEFLDVEDWSSDDPRERMAELEARLGVNIIQQLIAGMQQFVAGGQRRIERRAESFHHNGTDSPAGDTPTKDDAGSVVEPERKRTDFKTGRRPAPAKET